LVGLLAVRLRGDEHVDAELEARRPVDDLVAAAGGLEPPLRLPHRDRIHAAEPTARAAERRRLFILGRRAMAAVKEEEAKAALVEHAIAHVHERVGQPEAAQLEA